MTSGLPSVRARSNELRPGRVHAQDVADDQLLAGRARLVHHGLRAVHGGGQRLLDEDVAAGIEGLDAELLVGVGVGVYRDRIGPGFRKRLVHVLVARQRRELGGQVVAPADAAAAQPDELEALDLVVSERVAEPHVADAHHEHPDRSVLHGCLPFAFRPPGGARHPPLPLLLVVSLCRRPQTRSNGRRVAQAPSGVATMPSISISIPGCASSVTPTRVRGGGFAGSK